MDTQPTAFNFLFCALFGVSLLQCGDESSGTAGSGGAVAGGAAPTAGAPGAGGGGGEPCPPPPCEGFDQATCEASSADCSVISGVPWGGTGDAEFAGCQSHCCPDECGAVQAETCAHPSDDPNQCWKLPSGAIPDGWVTLSNVQHCSDFPQCSPKE